jgi:hypothetical protein
MKNVLAVLVSIVSFVMLMSCTSADKNKSASNSAHTATAADPSWSARMRGMAKNLETLMPYVFSRQEFNDSTNNKRIHDLIAEFSKSVDMVPKHAGEVMLGKDPIVKFSVQRLQSNTRSALEAFDEGHMDYARTVLSESMGLCFNCHTSTQFGPEDSFSTKQLAANFRIYPTERADYYVATRQFDRAIDVLEGVLKPAGLTANDNPHEQLAALRKYLSLEVRVKKDPVRAASTVESFLQNQKLPYFIATDAEAWLHSLREWQSEKTPKEPFSRAQTLLKKIGSRQTSQADQGAFVDYLRASSLLHEGLRETAKTETKAKIYQMLGKSYDTLSETGTWDLPEVYFEACVRATPKTSLSQQCYKDYERTVVLGFSGSAGVFLPKEQREHLAELKGIAGL